MLPLQPASGYVNNVVAQSLDTVLRCCRSDISTCLRLASQVTQTLNDLHAAHIIHRDVRPPNVMVSVDHGQINLIELRMPRAEVQQPDAGANPAAGDWAYCSPEQTGRMNRPVDYRTDFYSLGVLLYRMLAGQLPFQGKDPLEWAHCHVARLPPPLRGIAPTVPQPVADIVMRLLAKLPEDRYQSARGVQADLERCLAQWEACGRIEPFLLGTEDVPDRLQIPHKLYGREKEIARFLAAFNHMTESGQATLVTVAGYSGIGKSALVGEVRQPIIEKRGYFIAGKFDQYQRDIPYAPLTQAFRELVQQLLAESEERIAGWRQQIQAALGSNGQLIVDVLPQVELIIGKQAPVPPLPPTEAQNLFQMAFQKFVAVFSRKEHPLVLFLDDLQWIDAASLKLIAHLLTHADTRYLLLIGAYRDNEVKPAHPLRAKFKAIRHSGVPVTNLALAPLSVTELNRLTADALHMQAESCTPLTRQIFERTGGNPFFFTQFLSSLQEEGLLLHDANHRGWRWDIDSIASKDFADNVVDLVLGKLRRLPADTQYVLQRAACLGNKFDLRRLALICEQVKLEQSLAAAIHEGLIVCTNNVGKFLHDRIQQAAYSLIPPEERSKTHLHIGRILMANLTADELAESLFDVANQFNQGAFLLRERDEKALVAQINLRAGTKAKGATAYVSACLYFAAGMALLEEGDWDERYEFMYQLWLERAECEFLSGNFDSAEQCIAKLLQRSVSKRDQALVYRLKIDLHIVKSESPQAIASGFTCLRLFGIEMPEHPSREQLEAEYEKVWQNLGERAIESLIDLPPMTDPDMLAAMDVLSTLMTAASSSNLQCLLFCHMMNLTLKHGTGSTSAYGFAWFGVTLGSVFKRYAEGYRFAKLACDLVEKRDCTADKAKIYSPMYWVALWTQPVTSAIEFLQNAFRTAVETGDLATACHTYYHRLVLLMFRGDRLDTVWRESEKILAFERKAKYRDGEDVIVIQQRLIACMRGQTPSLSTFSDAKPDRAALDGAAFDEAAFEAELMSGERLSAVVYAYWTTKMQARFLSGDYAAALAAARPATLLSPELFLNSKILDYVYYCALTGAASYEMLSAEEQRAWRERLAALQAQLHEWAENNPRTFRDKYALVSAEIARLDGKSEEAALLYADAIHSAHANGFVQNEAIAYERASAFYRARGFDTSADLHLREARSCYVRWGAEGKVRQLDARYPQLQAQQPVEAPTAPWNEVVQLDMLSVAKASQAISGLIVLDELIDTLMRIVIENVGAQSGYLLLVRQGQLSLVAETHLAQQDVRVQLRREPGLPASTLPESILNYVRRSREKVLLADATVPHPFATDPYFARRQPKSLSCLPIIRQATLIGLLYLENDLVTHAFTPDRVAVMELLASQAAISLENAQLYGDLQQENAERKRAEEALRERDTRIRRLVESNIIGIVFSDLHGGVIDANDAFLQIVGYSRQDLLSGQVRSLIAPEYLVHNKHGVEEIMQTKAIAPFESEFVRKDGSRVPVLIGVALLEGSPNQAISFVLDLSERKQAEAEREARQTADAANRAKSEFLANMSHELRTPLNGILGYAQILLRDKALGERQSAGLNVIRQSGEHLLTLINDILDLAKIEAGKLELSPGDLPLAAFLRVIGDIISVKAEQKGLDFILDIAPEVPAGIQADEKRLRQVLLNLLSNAVKFTDHGQVSLRVHFLPPARLRFEVQDTGVGIGQEQLDTIFQPFEQVGEMRRRAGGTGLGLAISRQFVRLMGGEIRIESRIGQGSTFWFELDAPVVKAEAAALPAETIVTGYTGPRKTVLVVDDVAENRAVAIDMLRPLGFTIVEAVNGYEGLEKARVLQPDLILMDIVMPEMGGLEAMRRLRQGPAGKEVPVIAISASASGDNQASSLAAGANAFLPKPVDLEQLLTQIGALLKLTWTYESPSGGAPEQEAAGPLLMPPAQEMAALHRLARLGNMHDIGQWASELAGRDERYRPFANQLCQLAKGYQSKAILNLVKQYLEKSA